MDEFSFIEYLRKKATRSSRVLIGIGDDAAVLSVAKNKRLIVSSDVIVENVDFKLKTLSPEKIGRKALAVNLSDMAAMGALPTSFVINIGKPSYVTTLWLKRFYKGLFALAKQFGVVCVGGDFSKSKEFFASVTIFGEASPDRIVKRSGAKPGDWIAVTGALGGSLLRHHHEFTPRVREGLFLAQNARLGAMIDISDGLVQDLFHILKSSKVGAVLDLDGIPVSHDAKTMSCGHEAKALRRALSDGEDFEILFTVTNANRMKIQRQWRKKFPGTPLSWIGRIEKGTPGISWRRNGKPAAGLELSQKGFSHF
ncbi:MAG: thiamine-phosphate kinase [Candidatus Omnitrophota bacterium]